MRRQDRMPPDTPAARAHWERYWSAAAQTPGMQPWGALVDEQLAAYVLTVRMEDRCEFLLARSNDGHLHQYPNNALIYTVAREMLQLPDVTAITFGLESLESVEALDQFKFAMGFRRRPLRQCVVMRPGLATALQTPGLERAVRWYAARPGVHPAWRKLVGIMTLIRGDAPAMACRSDASLAH
jgi:hypothetical protein